MSANHRSPVSPEPFSTATQLWCTMWTGLTSNISPNRNTIATQETMSAWFWMTNSWLSTGGFLFAFFRIPISAWFGLTFLLPRSSVDAVLTLFRPADVFFYFPRMWEIAHTVPRDSVELRPGCNWMACHSCVVGGSSARPTTLSTNGRADRTAAHITTHRWGGHMPPLALDGGKLELQFQNLNYNLNSQNFQKKKLNRE